ncbi:hypothetical protein ON010_g12616 [Phytophthora cinnamomi]|nr:hypothetical protein ON010_g12616 [Phytophthora cinnamomi]
MAPKPKHTLPPCGYLVVYLGLQPEVLVALQAEARSEAKSSGYVPVVKEVGCEHDDAFCEQARVKKAAGAIRELKIALKRITTCLDPQWLPSVLSFMRSRPGGEEQESHHDYPKEVIAVAKKGNRLPASIVLALERGPGACP